MAVEVKVGGIVFADRRCRNARDYTRTHLSVVAVLESDKKHLPTAQQMQTCTVEGGGICRGLSCDLIECHGHDTY